MESQSVQQPEKEDEGMSLWSKTGLVVVSLIISWLIVPRLPVVEEIAWRLPVMGSVFLIVLLAACCFELLRMKDGVAGRNRWLSAAFWIGLPLLAIVCVLIIGSQYVYVAYTCFAWCLLALAVLAWALVVPKISVPVRSVCVLINCFLAYYAFLLFVYAGRSHLVW